MNIEDLENIGLSYDILSSDKINVYKTISKGSLAPVINEVNLKNNQKKAIFFGRLGVHIAKNIWKN